MQYKNTFSKILPGNQELHLKLYANHFLIVENFEKIMDIKEDKIIIDDYIILGEFLKISKMENGRLEINGEIKEILLA